MNTDKIKNIAGIVFLVAALALGYWYFFWDSGSSSVSQPTQDADTQSQQVAELVQLLNSFQEIDIDPTAMDRIPYEQLRDFRLEVQTGVQGRANPFAPSDALPNPSTQ